MAAHRNLLLVPGLLCTADLFAPQIADFGEEIRCVVADHRRADSIPAIASGILEEAPSTFALAGLSMGGYLSFEILRQAPDRVEALILLDTSARGETEAQTARRHELIELARAEGIDPVIEQLLPYFVDEDNVVRLRDTVVKMARDTGVDAFVRQETAIANRVSSLEMLPQILCPTTVIVGGRDRLTAPEVNQEIADNVPGAEYYRIDRCGHLSTLEAPARVNEIMRHALRL